MEILKSAGGQKMRALGLLFVGFLCCGAGQSQVDELLKQAKFARPQESKKIAEKILAIDPKCGDAYTLLAYSKFYSADFDGAIKDCTKAISLHPKDIFYFRSALNYRYHCYIHQQNWKRALTDCLETLKIEHTAGVAHDASLLCEKVGDKAGAEKYEKLSETYMAESKAHMMAVMQTEKDARDPAKVDEILEKVNEELKKNPKNLQAYSLRADCYDTKKEYDKACQDLSKLITAEPSAWPAYVRRAEIYKKAGDKKKSEEDYQKARKLGFDPARMQAFAKLRKERAEKMQHPTPSMQPD